MLPELGKKGFHCIRAFNFNFWFFIVWSVVYKKEKVIMKPPYTNGLDLTVITIFSFLYLLLLFSCKVNADILIVIVFEFPENKDLFPHSHVSDAII